jgi:CIC family chloride channel protein
MIANMSAYALARYLRPTPIYEALLEQDGIRLSTRRHAGTLAQVELSALPLVGAGRARVRDSSLAADLLRAALPVGQCVFPVVNAADELVGLIGSDELGRLEANTSPSLTASDIMRPPVSVRFDTTLLAALDILRAEQLSELPVVDDAGRVAGFVDEAAIAAAHLQLVHPASAAPRA